MLISLVIRDFILARQIDLELAPGFSVLTGETGAGKSILLGALGLVLGERADATLVRHGAARAEITAEFSFPEQGIVTDWLRENDLEGDPGLCVLRRVIESEGRARAQINGRSATQAQLRILADWLVDVHGQHAHYALLKSARHLEWLDAALAIEYALCAKAWRHWQQAEQRLEVARASADSAAQAVVQWQWVCDDLRQLALGEDEWNTVQAEHTRLSHAAELLAGAAIAAAQLDGEDDALLGRLATLRHALATHAELDGNLNEWLTLIDSAESELQEAARGLQRYAERAEHDPGQLALLDVRLAEISAAARRHRVRPEDLSALAVEAQKHLAEAEMGADLAALETEVKKAQSIWQREADALTQQRLAGAPKLAQAVTEAMQTLSMEGGRFAIDIAAAGPSATGQDQVEFKVAPHAGQALKPLAETASGGELSRVGLALQTVSSSRSGAPTLIFDEVDSGIGGRVAAVVGANLAKLGQSHQVLCVTHLPQVAAAATGHWVVEKTLQDGAAISRVKPVTGAARIEELARMLGGAEMTETTRKHATELLGLG